MVSEACKRRGDCTSVINTNFSMECSPWRHYTSSAFFKDVELIHGAYSDFVPPRDDILKYPGKYNLKRKSDTLADNLHSCEIDIDTELISKNDILDNLVYVFINEGARYIESILEKSLRDTLMRVQLIRDVDGYYIKSHTDKSNKLVTLQCHLTDLDGAGTQLLNRSEEIVKRTSSRRNNCCMFFPNYNPIVKTYHSFTDTPIADVRDTIMVNYFSDGNVANNDSLWRVNG